MAKKGKSKGFLGKAASFLGSIPSVGNVAKKAKTAVKSTAKKAGNAVKATAKKAKTAAKSTAKKAKKAVKSTAKKAKKAASSAKKKIKKKAKKAKKKLGKVYTKARKTANNLSKSKMVKQVKQAAKKAVLTTKKAAQKTKKAVKKAGKQVKAAVKDTKKFMTKVAGKIAKTATKEIKNPVVKSFNSFKEIGSDFKSGLDTRTNKALNSPYDFANYLTLGAVDGIWSGSKSRMDKKFDSSSDFLNYASFGFTGMVQGAVNPKDPLSKEHWLDSVGVATSVLGVKGVSSTKTAGVTSGKSTSSSSSSNGKSNKGTGKAQTGGRELSVDEYLKRLDEADDMYESFRKSKTDVNSIAKNTGMTEQRVQRIKEHLLFKEHIKEHGVGRFDSDYEIAQAWDRLQKGTHKKNDIDLLNHELFESKFEGIFKTDYRTAHDKTVESGRPWHPPEEE